MTSSQRPRLRAPKLDNQFVVVAADKPATTIASNRKRIAEYISEPISSISSSELLAMRARARARLLHDATEYSISSCPSISINGNLDASTTPLIISGHQPEFFHPGVWFKNFLIHKLGLSMQGSSINIIIDNDICESRSIKAPTGDLADPRRISIPYDSVFPVQSIPVMTDSENQVVRFADSSPAPSPLRAEHSVLPYEMARWNDLQILNKFCEELHTAVDEFLPEKLIADLLWPDMVEPLSHGNAFETCHVGTTIARARYRLESKNGVENLEIPLSRLCDQVTFHQFLSDLLLNSNSFHRLYNSALDQFRKENRVRSQSHPVPRLVQTDPWLEMPFWIWSTSSPWRGPMYVCVDGGSVLLSDLDSIECRLDATNLVDELGQLNSKGIFVRPRALMTTTYCRIFLADLFVHGIGGAKYDELTDRIIRAYFGIEPPQFLTATSTHFLPLEIDPFDEAELRHLGQLERELRFNPDRHLARNSASGDVNRLLEIKKKLLASIPPRGQKKSWHEELHRVNGLLRTQLTADQVSIPNKIQSAVSKRRKTGILRSREYSFLLHPPSLIDSLNEIADQATDNLL